MIRTLLLVLFCSTTLIAQSVISFEEQVLVTKQDLNDASGLEFDFDVLNFKVLYTTTDAFGQPDTASGLVCIPESSAYAYPLGIYNHGTVADREAVPSREGIQERLLPQFMAGRGIITVAPDYLGLGDSDGIHPYVHAATEISAGKDLLLAVKDWLPTIDVAHTEGVFITGYSQGGHAAAALHRELSTNPIEGLPVLAATHLSGPYSISEVMLNTLFSEQLATLPGYIAYTYISYNYVYGLYDDLSDAFVEPYLTPIRRFANEEVSLGQFNTTLTNLLTTNGDLLSAIFQDSIRQVLAARDTNSSLIQALMENDTYDWSPTETTLIYYCTEDEQVPFRNAILADSVMAANGSTSVALQSSSGLNHRDCLDPAFGLSLAVFTALVDLLPIGTEEVANRPDIKAYPNPASPGTLVHLTGEGTANRPVRLYSPAGKELFRGMTSADGALQLPAWLPAGIKILRLSLPDETFVIRRLIVR